MNEILLEDILQLNKYSSRVKVRFHQYNGYDDPMDIYKVNPDKESLLGFILKSELHSTVFIIYNFNLIRGFFSIWYSKYC